MCNCEKNVVCAAVAAMLITLSVGPAATALADEQARALAELSDGRRISASFSRDGKGNVISVSITCTYGLWDDPRPFDKSKWLPQFADQMRAFPKLQKVSISNWAYSDDDLQHLANIPQLTAFSNDDAFGNAEPFTGEGLKHLVMPASLEEVSLTGKGISDEGLRQVGKLKSLEKLHVYADNVTDAGLAHLKPLNLVALAIHSSAINGEGLAHLSKMPLRVLLLSDNNIETGLKHIAGLERLTKLTLGSNQISDDEIQHLNGLSQLTELELNRNKITDAGLAHLSELRELQKLDLRDNQIRGEGVKHLSGLRNLESVMLGDNHELGDTAIGPLAELPKLAYISVNPSGVSLEALKKFRQQRPMTELSFRPSRALGLRDVWHVNLDDDWRVKGVGISGIEEMSTDKDLAQFSKKPELADVESISMPFPQGITGKGLAHLSSIRNLKKLHLDECDVGDEGLKHIGKLTALEILEIDKGEITGEGLKHLANLVELRQLTLTNNGLKDEDLDFLRHLPKLESVNLSENDVSAEHVASLLAEAKRLERLNVSRSSARGDRIITGEGLKRLREKVKPSP